MGRLQQSYERVIDLEYRSKWWQLAFTVVGFVAVIGSVIGLIKLASALGIHDPSGKPIPPSADAISLILAVLSAVLSAYFAARVAYRRNLEREVRSSDPELFRRLESDIPEIFEEADSPDHA